MDDDPAKGGQILSGVRIYSSSEFPSLTSLYEPVKLLLAINNISKGDRLRLVEKLSGWPIEVQSVPSVEDIAAGKALATDIKDLAVSDLLGREPVEPDAELMSKNIAGKSVMVTGAGGSIGSELCRQILAQQPEKLVLFELNEYNLYAIHQELTNLKNHLNYQTEIISALGSVQNKNRLMNIMSAHNIQTVYHAAHISTFR